MRVVGVALTDVKEIVVSGRNYDVVYIEDFRTHRIEKVLVQSIEFKDSLFKNPDGSPVEIVVKEE